MNNPINLDEYEAVLFDLDGILTQTEKIHSLCWKKTFDDFLKEYSKEHQTVFAPFSIESDYLNYVDGKPRNEGVKDFLQSRNISLPEGSISSPTYELSVRGLGNKKNKLFNKKILIEKIEIYDGSIRLLKLLKSNGFKLAVVSSSKNCKTILSSAKLEDSFDYMVDGNIAEKRGLKGKPEPDTYLEASNYLGVKPNKSVVIEDAISGVRAAKLGNFGLVIGVARKNNVDELAKNGADIVVEDLGEFLT